MDQEDFGKYLKDRYLNQITWYDEKAIDNQRKYRRLQWLVIILAAVTPALIELDLNTLVGQGIGHLATITSVAVAILTTALKTFKYQENWINYRTTCETLRKEKHYYDAKIGEYQNANDRNALFIERVESMISRENTLWVSAHKPESKKTEKINK